MYRIGIIGTENSHAMAFAKLMNQGADKRARVVGVMGPDGTAEKVAAEAGVDFIAKDASDFFGKVDAMMITCRHGSRHAAFARPFIEAGMPMFIDKPLTSDLNEAAALLGLAKAGGVPVCGGSGCKYAPAVAGLKARAEEMRAEGKLLSMSMAFSADPASEYDGLHFYAPHLTEMALTILGGGMESVSAVPAPNGALVTARYPDLLASLHYVSGATPPVCTLYGKGASVTESVDISQIHAEETARFLRMLETREMPHSYEDLLRPVQVVCAIVEAMKSGATVALPRLTV